MQQSVASRAWTSALTISLRLLLICLLLGALESVTGCSQLPPNRDRARRDLESGFPGFTIEKLEGRDHFSLPISDGVDYSTIDFRLRSEDVTGFVIAGEYLVYLPTLDKRQVSQAFTNTMFSRHTLSRAQLVGLQKLWVQKFPGQAVIMRDSTWLGPVGTDGVQKEVEPLVAGLDTDRVYGWPSVGRYYHYYYFYLEEPGGVEWTYLGKY